MNGGGTVDAAALDSILNVIQDDPDVQWIEPDVGVGLADANTDAFSGNDPRVPWGLQRIGAAQAALGEGVSDVDLYVLDSGVHRQVLNLASCHDATGDSLVVCAPLRPEWARHRRGQYCGGPGQQRRQHRHCTRGPGSRDESADRQQDQHPALVGD